MNEPIYMLRIDPDGTMSPINEFDAMPLAQAEFDGMPSVVVLHNPILGSGMHVGWIHDFGAVKQLPVNRKAWALYGGSPIYGTMFVVNDVHEPFDTDTIDALLNTDWIGPEINAAMDDWLAAAKHRSN